MPRKPNQDITKETFWSAKEVAAKLKVSDDTIHREMERGHLPYVMAGGRRRILESDLTAYLNSRYRASGLLSLDANGPIPFDRRQQAV